MTYLVWKLLSWPKVSVTIPALLTGAVLAMVVVHIGNSFQAQAMMNDVIFYGAGVCSAKQIHAKLSHFKQNFLSEYPWVLTRTALLLRTEISKSMALKLRPLF